MAIFSIKQTTFKCCHIMTAHIAVGLKDRHHCKPLNLTQPPFYFELAYTDSSTSALLIISITARGYNYISSIYVLITLRFT